MCAPQEFPHSRRPRRQPTASLGRQPGARPRPPCSPSTWRVLIRRRTHAAPARQTHRREGNWKSAINNRQSQFDNPFAPLLLPSASMPSCLAKKKITKRTHLKFSLQQWIQRPPMRVARTSSACPCRSPSTDKQVCPCHPVAVCGPPPDALARSARRLYAESLGRRVDVAYNVSA